MYRFSISSFSSEWCDLHCCICNLFFQLAWVVAERMESVGVLGEGCHGEADDVQGVVGGVGLVGK